MSAQEKKPKRSKKVNEQDNNLLALGAVYGALRIGASEINLPEERTNSLTVRFRFLKSAYRVTVERIPGSERD